MDVCVIDPRFPYEQRKFEESMEYAVKHAAAVYCPMDGPYQESLGYLSRPWCSFECGLALRRDVFWCATEGTYTVPGRWRARKQGLCEIVLSALLFVILMANNIWYRRLVGYMSAPDHPGGYCFRSTVASAFYGLLDAVRFVPLMWLWDAVMRLHSKLPRSA